MGKLGWVVHDAPIGALLLVESERGLVQVVFHADPRTAERALAATARRLGAEPAPGGPVLDDLRTQLDAYFDGRSRTLRVPLDWSLTAGFNRRVQQALHARVPYGAVASYQQLADWVGEPGAARAVGVAMASNPLPVVVPCHRVVESDGGLGGFGGGLETKRQLLALEGVLPPALF